MPDILSPSCSQIVEANNPRSIRQEQVAEMRTEKASTASDEDKIGPAFPHDVPSQEW
ncbi:hypothetical protein ACX4MT_02085 [Roseomonas mucosa]